MADEIEVTPEVKLARTLFDDPETRPLIEEAVAKKFPNAPIPGRKERLEGQRVLDEVRKEREAFKAEVEAERGRTLLESERNRARAKGITDAELPAVEQLMKDRLIGDHETAAEFYRSTQQVAAPRSIYSTMDVPGRGNHGDEFKGVNGGPSILQDRDQWARQMTDQILNDFHANPSGAAKKWA